MNYIDAHAHAFPDSLATHAIASLESQGDWKAVSGGTVAELIESMDQAGVAVSVLCQIATKPAQAEKILQWSEKIRSERILPQPSIHPQTPDPAEWIKRIADCGFKGIKLHPFYQDFNADDEIMYPIYEAVVENDLVVTLHCGYDIAYPPDWQNASPFRLSRVAEKFSDMKFICTHFGAWKDWNNVEKFLVGKNVYFETSLSLPFMETAQIRRIIENHGTDKILFGTDWPWFGQLEAIEQIKQLGFDPQVTDAILGNNARRLFGL